MVFLRYVVYRAFKRSRVIQQHLSSLVLVKKSHVACNLMAIHVPPPQSQAQNNEATRKYSANYRQAVGKITPGGALCTAVCTQTNARQRKHYFGGVLGFTVDIFLAVFVLNGQCLRQKTRRKRGDVMNTTR